MDAFKVKYTTFEKILHILTYIAMGLLFETFLLIAVLLA